MRNQESICGSGATGSRMKAKSPASTTASVSKVLATGRAMNSANRRLQPFRYLHDCSDCFRLERIAGWVLHPLESAALSRRTPIADIRGSFLTIAVEPFATI